MHDICAKCGCVGHSVTSAHVDLAIDNNGTWSDAFQFGDDDDRTWTLNGQSFALDVQLNYFDAVPKLSITSGAGEIVIADPIQRVVYFNVPPASIQASLKPGMYVYDLIMIDGATSVRVPLMHGTVEVTQGVTGV
jgi:hypothetical protein